MTEMEKLEGLAGTAARAHPLGVGGQQLLVDYSNRYGVSVVTFRGSYGYEEGLLELAVFKDGSLCYDTPITSDVVGHLTAEEAFEIMKKVEALPAPPPVTP